MSVIISNAHASKWCNFIDQLYAKTYVPLCSKMSCNSFDPSSDMSVSNFTLPDAALTCDLEWTSEELTTSMYYNYK